MNIKKQVLLSLTFFFFSLSLFSQYLELGALVGTSNYLGDLQENRIEKVEAHMAIGLFSRYTINRRIAIRGHFYSGKVSGSDTNFDSEERKMRNLSFQSKLFEIAAQGEFSFLHLGRDKNDPFFRAYVFGGLGTFFFNPRTRYQEKWVKLRDLGTEGQGLSEYPDKKKYSLASISIPLGAGIKVNVFEYSAIGFEFGWRKIFTDYLDDISGEYPDIDLLRERDPLAAALSFRAPEYTGQSLENPVGQKRGRKEGKDAYLLWGITFSTYIDKWREW